MIRVALLVAAALTLAGCTAAQGQITGEILTGLCDAGSVVLGVPGAVPICADISLVEQLIANWNKTQAAAGATVARPMTQADLYAMVKASGRYTPARAK